MPKGIPKSGKREISTVKCKICKSKYKLNGFESHLKHTHSLSPEEYRNLYGEYRPKLLEYKSRSSNNDSLYKCKICNKELASERHLTYHIRLNHNLSKEDYVTDYIFSGNIPKCKCGCGGEVSIKNQHPYHSEFISGHNIYETHLGSSRSYTSRMKMRKSAINRVKNNNSTFHKHGPSASEQEIYDFIDDNIDTNIIQNDTSLLSGLELDIYLPELKLAFEYNGSRFHSYQYKEKNYHLNKTKECNLHGIDLIHIWEPDWIQKRSIIKSMILSKLGKIDTRIYGRKTEVREIDFQTSKQFLIDNHLQGNSVSSIRYGLYYNNELVQVMTFGKLRRAVGHKSKKNSYELLRFCSKKNTVVIGGANKLFSTFIKKHNPHYVLSFANRDWYSGNVYSKMGFDFNGYTSIGYFYVKGKRKYHRYKFQKHKLVEQGEDPLLTEYEIMLKRGYYKIWDTGNSKFIWKIICKKL